MQGSRPKSLILVVEDDDDVRRLITTVLEKAGNEVLTASNGEEGLALACMRPQPKLIISDIMMPDVDGLMMVRRLKSDAQTKSLPVIFLTAKDTPQDIINGIGAGARHYLTKPFRIPDLLDKVNNVLKK